MGEMVGMVEKHQKGTSIMPCNSDYMEASTREVAISRVLCLMDELETGLAVNTDHQWWRGYHPDVYNASDGSPSDDEVVAELCRRLGEVEDISKYSLEMQVWWRDHQKADQVRKDGEELEQHRHRLRVSGLAKLSQEEREALGLGEKA